MSGIEENYEKLANAIIIQAADDYRKAAKRLKHNPNHRESKETIEEVERFFRSDWYSVLTDVDGEFLLRKLKEEAGL